MLQILVLALCPRVCLLGRVAPISFLPRNWVQGPISQAGSQLGVTDATLTLQPACLLWRGWCEFSVFCCCANHALVTEQGRHAAGELLGTSASCPLLHGWSRSEGCCDPAGEQSRNLPEGAGLLLALQSPALPSSCPRNTTQRRTRLRETTLLCHVQSAWLRGCSNASVPPLPGMSSAFLVRAGFPGLRGVCVLHTSRGKLLHCLDPSAHGDGVSGM